MNAEIDEFIGYEEIALEDGRVVQRRGDGAVASRTGKVASSRRKGQTAA
jgi:hypothetical protein